MTRRALVPVLVIMAACDASNSGLTTPDGASPPGDATAMQVPPTGRVAIEAWLAAGHYLSWSCEPSPHPARPPGAHGVNRICSNAAIAGTTGGALPPGAASVKELYERGTRIGFAVAIKQQADSADGAGWYWFENFGGTIYADGAGVSLCTSCHEDADDFVFTRVPG